MLRAPKPPPMRSILTALINEIAALPSDFVLVLDDYHTIQTEAIHEALTFLLEHAPPQLHLAIASRTDPPLSLARLLGRGQLVELRDDDLRFTAPEATAFLNQVMGLDLSPEQIAALDAQTEGWIVGLQMAALSMRGREDIAGFVTSFSGSHRRVVDYLIEEVLGRQTERVQDFLLRTSVLNRMCGPLCDALTGQGNGRATLRRMERANLFTVPLDDERHWYRYHHLFADVLRGRLRETQPEQVSALHRRAAEWYMEGKLPEEAVRHAFAADDMELAADLIEQSLRPMWMRRERGAMLAWLQSLPEALIRSRPSFCIWYAWLIMNYEFDLDAVEARVQDAERAVSTEAEKAGDDAQAQAEVRHLLGKVAALRVAAAQRRGDLPRAIELSRQALLLVPEDDALWRAHVFVMVGRTHLFSGDALAAERSYLEAGKLIDVAALAKTTWTMTLMQRGHLRHAVDVCRQPEPQLQTRAWKRGSSPHDVSPLYSLARVLYEWNDLDAAIPPLLESIRIAEHWDSAPHPAIGYQHLAQVYRARGKVNKATDAMEKLIQLLPRLPNTHSMYVSPGSARAMAARYWLADGDVEAASRWARASGLSLDDFRYSYFGIVEALTLVRVRIAQAREGGGKTSLDRVLRFLIEQAEQAEAHGRMWNLIEILVLQALARQVQGDVAGALAALERALSLAEPEGYVRTFVDEGQPMAELLRLAAARGIAPGYVAKLLAAYGKEPAAAAPAAQPLVEPLSEGELEVLRLLAEGLTDLEIAQALSVTVGTVKTDVNHIHGKLEVHGLAQAVARARELGLLES